jgi:hypothetical protein
MKRTLLLLLALALPAGVMPQEQAAPQQSQSALKLVPVLSQYSNDFTIGKVAFNKRIEISGKGELLEVEFELRNRTDYPLDLYIFVIASYEVTEKTRSSFEPPIPPEKRIRSFIPYPDDIDNFRVPMKDAQGNVKKDRQGHDMYQYIKYPHDVKKGIDEETGKPYRIKEKKYIRTYHLSPYRSNYFFFNHATILVFDPEGNPVFRQIFELKGWRR